MYTSVPQHAKLAISKTDWATIEYMKPILEMFESATQIFQSNEPTKQSVLPVLWALQKVLQKHQDVPGAWGLACKRAEDKLVKYLLREENNHQTLVSTLLEPEYRDLPFRRDPSRVAVEISAKRSLRDEYDSRKPEPRQSSSADTTASVAGKGRKPAKPAVKTLKDIYSLLGTGSVSSTSNSVDDMDEIDQYLNGYHPLLANESIGQYWTVSPFFLIRLIQICY